MRLRWAGWLLLAAALIIPRLLWLDADAYPDLCWGSGIWSDEGFYTHHAKSVVLGGWHPADQFHNELLSPLLDAIQRAVFTFFGVGLLPARAISVGFGLLALGFFYGALRQLFNRRVALTGLLFLGCDSHFLLYNRLALMESAAVCVVCAALWAWSRRGVGWQVLAGAIAGSAIAWKTNFLIFLPLPIVVGVLGRRPGWQQRLVAYGAGAGLALALYGLLWWWPHHSEIVRLNAFYWGHQSKPHSLHQALFEAQRWLLGYQFGMLQRLCTRAPVLALLAGIGLATLPLTGKRREAYVLLALWVVGSIAFLSITRYVPTRYYLMFYPAWVALAAATLWRLPVLLRRVRRWQLAVPVGVWCYHLPQALLWLQPSLRRYLIPLSALIAVPLALGLVALALRCPVPRAGALGRTGLALFLLGNIGVLGYYFTHRQYRTRDFAAQLAALTTPGSRVIGDWAPNLCLASDRLASPVLIGLANDRDPIRSLDAGYALIGTMPYQQAYWSKYAPQVLRPENLLTTFRLYDYTMELYRIPATEPAR